MLIMLFILLWLVVGLLLAVRFREARQISDFELTRLSGMGDKKARELLLYRQRESELDSFRDIVVKIFSTATVTTGVFAFGLWWGIILGLVVLILAPLLSRLPFVRELADKVRDWSRPYVLKVAGWGGPVLASLRERDTDPVSQRLYSQDELLDVLHHSPHVLTPEQLKRLTASLSLDERTVGEVMTPRSVIETADVHDTLGPLVLDDLHKTGHSRFPVIEGDIDHVVGILYVKELLELKSEHQTVRAAMNPKVYYIHENQSLTHALHGFLRSHHHLFVVVNEYRETVGLLTLEDVIEALLGAKIRDEFDQFDDLRAVAESNPHRNNQTAKSQDV